MASMTPIDAINTLTQELEYSVQEIADYLGCSRAYIYQIRSGKETGYKVGQELEALIQHIEKTGDRETVEHAPTQKQAKRPLQAKEEEEEQGEGTGGIAWGSLSIGALIGGVVGFILKGAML